MTEQKKDNPPFEGGHKIAVYRDKFGNVIKTKNMAKHLAKKGMRKAMDKNRKVDEAIKPKSREDEGEYGYEGDMAMSQLRSIVRNCQQMLDKLDEKTDLPEWVQSKITLAQDYIETSANYLMSELEEQKINESHVNNAYTGKERRDTSPEGQTRRKFIGALKQRAAQKKKLGEAAEDNAKSKKVMDKYRGIRNKVNTKPQLNVSIRNTTPHIMGNIPGHEGPKPNAIV